MKCVDNVIKKNVSCDNKECRYFLKYENDLNCMFIAIQKNGDMKLEEIGSRLNLTPARIYQLQDAALNKINKRIQALKILEE